MKKWWCQQNSAGVVRWLIYFLGLLYVRYSCTKFHHCSICVTDSTEGGGPFVPPHPWAASKRSILNRVEQSKSFSNFWLLLKEIIPTMFHASSFTTILSWSQQDKKINHHYQLKAWVTLGSALMTFFHICFDRHCFFICISLKDMKSDIKNCYLTQCFNSVIWHSVS